ncbi:MAG: hypothetical protein CMH56_08295 [Myxococcales bacterium]|nr:hypothetical protein [Myxococcales bacterium]
MYAFIVFLFIMAISGCSGVLLEDLPGPTVAKNLLVVVHGSGDTPKDWPNALRAAIEKEYGDGLDWDIWTYDWDVYAASRMTASGDGLVVGQLLGEALLESPYDYQHLHLVAHSAGSYVIHALAQTVSTQKSDMTIHATYLDPFTANGFFDWSYGQREFGRHADYAENFMNVDDPVPSTNNLLEHAHNFDVTALRPDDYDNTKTHWWPVDYYRESVANDERVGYAHSQTALEEGLDTLKSQFPKGEVTMVND